MVTESNNIQLSSVPRPMKTLAIVFLIYSLVKFAFPDRLHVRYLVLGGFLVVLGMELWWISEKEGELEKFAKALDGLMKRAMND